MTEQERARAWGRMKRQGRRNREIYRRRERGEPLAEIGADYGITSHRVWQIHRRESEILQAEGAAV